MKTSPFFSFALLLGGLALSRAQDGTNRTIAIIKNTALGTVIGVPEILNQATSAVSFSSNATPLTLAAIGYLVIFLPVVILGRWIETRFAWKRA